MYLLVSLKHLIYTTAEAAANMNELSRINAKCYNVSAVSQDPAIQNQKAYAEEQMRNYGIIQ
jgi:hypothetical protein